MPFRIALSGLDAASTDLEVTGHNIANASTNGFKESRAEFADLYATSLQDVSATAAGNGVRVTRIAQQFSQGTVDFTANNLDLAVNGEGFFMVKDLSGSTSLTRAGAYSVDRDGNVVNHSNKRLQIFPPIDEAGDRFNTGTTVDLVLPTLSGTPSATDEVTAALNLSSSTTTPTVTWPAAPASSDEANVTTEMYNHATSTTVYDSLGSAHRATMYYVNTATPGEWQGYTYIDGILASGPTGDSVTLTFDPEGKLIPSAGDMDASGQVTLNTWEDDGNGDGLLSNGANAVTLTYDYINATQFGTDFSVNNLAQNGFTAGRLTGIDIDSTGIVFARFTNGQSLALGKVALAKVNSPQGLRQQGETSWAETFASGDLQMAEAGTSSLGLVQSGALENSNVDIADQLVNLITAQRNFQANAQVITTADSITQTIINLR